MNVNILGGGFMRDKFYYLAGGFMLVLLAGFIYITDGMRIGPAGFGPMSLVSDAGLYDERLDEIYNLKFTLNNSRTQTNAAVYIPIYAAFDDPSFYADLFSSDGAVAETDEYFVFDVESGRLYVHKHQGLLVFESKLPRPGTISATPALSQDEAIDALVVFLENRFLKSDFHEAVINFDDENGIYEIKLINKLAGLSNYAFPITASVNTDGEILRLEYYTMEFERFADVSLKTMKQAYRELPLEFAEEIEIDLKRATLVYFFENSIVQPAYIFEGEITTGGGFRCFIPAARYE